MIKSINYQANQIASIEISDASDVQSLGDSYGYGSTARVTGQIGDEYIYTPQGWIKISSGGGGNVLIVHGTIDMSGEGEAQEYPMTIDKTLAEIAAADYSVLVADFDGMFYELPEVARHQTEGTLDSVSWGIQVSDSGMIAAISNQGQGYFEIMEADSDIFVLHGTLTSETAGTISESASELLTAANNKQRIMLEFTMGGATINLELGPRYFYRSDDTDRINADGFLYFSENSSSYLVKVMVSNADNAAVLTMSADYFVLTPAST